jgi:lipopolysaccharide assembly outer membrane protein LptD (OstA)
LRKLAFAILICVAASAGAQVAGPRPRPRPAVDTTRTDSTKVDSAQAKVLIKWEEPDSMTTALLARQGFEITRYQGVKVTFNAKSRTLYLEGDPAGVSRGATVLIGDTITYNDSTKVVLARGDTLILRDPARGQGDVIALHQMRYNVETRRGNVLNVTTSLESGEKWLVSATNAGFISDTTAGRSTRFYAKNGSITSCDDSIPDYHFQAKEIKISKGQLMVARPAVLYIADVPVFWLPFIFQDMRSGRRSGLLTPRFGVNEIFRNSPSYRRHVDNFGYYFAFSDYMDAQLTMDWRSGAASSEGDPGWFRANGEWRYRWLDRFMTGRFGISQLWQRDGNRNTAYSWAHQQDFSQTTHLTTDINYVTSTVLQRQNSFNPNQALATIQSRASYQQQFGPATFSIGGSRIQYPGRPEVTQDFPNFNISTPTLAFGKWLEWTPGLTVSNSQHIKVNRNGEFAYRYKQVDGGLDSTRLTSDARVSSLGFSTPLRIFGFTLSTSVRVADLENDEPRRIRVVDQANPGQTVDRVFAKTYSTEVDWQTGFSLPQLLSTTLKLSPSISIGNVDGHGYWVRTEQSGGRYVHQSKRLSYGVMASPTLFGLFPGIGPITRFRQTITPVISYSYAPAATVSNEFLAALNIDPRGYLPSLAANQVTLSLAQVLEGKLRTKDTASTAEARKVKLLGVNFSSLAYDFERKRKTGHSGFTTETMSAQVNSDLLPGFAGGVDYSLFQGSVQSDTSKFKPFRTGISASFSVNGNSGIFGALTRIFGRGVPTGTPQDERLGQGPLDDLERRTASTPVAGSSVRTQQASIPSFQSWQASFTFSSQRQRPPVGNAEVVILDPKDLCNPWLTSGNQFAYDACVLQQQTNPVNAGQIGGITAGGPFVRVPSRETLTSNMGFHITPKWSATWGTTYDFAEHQFAAHSVTLQRELHDWRSIFAFTRSPNGNFAFNFFIALNAQPDLKFNFDRQTYRQTNQ